MLKLNVGVSRKVGEPNYGSRGASVHLEAEVESSLAGNIDSLQERIHSLFRLADAEVEEELGGGGHRSPRNEHDSPLDDHQRASSGSGGRRSNGRPATASQVRAIQAIANRLQIDLSNELQSRFGAADADDLSLLEASDFIDLLKSQTNGNGGGR